MSCGPSGIMIMKSMMCVNCTAASSSKRGRSASGCFALMRGAAEAPETPDFRRVDALMRKTACDDEDLTVDPAGIGRGKEEDDGGNVVGLADATQWRLRDRLLLEVTTGNSGRV